MMRRDRDDIVDDIKTLDEAKELIQYLLKSQRATNTVLTYELRTPLLLIAGYAEMAQREDSVQEIPFSLKIIIKNVGRIQRMIDALRDEARFEWYRRQESLLKNFPPETVSPSTILLESASRIQANIDLDNEIHVLRNEIDIRKDNRRSSELINLNLSVDEKLPNVQYNSAMLAAIMLDITWLLSEPYIDNIFLKTSFDEQWVKVIFGYSTNSSFSDMLEKFRQFENIQTPPELYGESLSLYNIWRKLKAYGAELSLNIQEKTEANKSSSLEATIALKR